VENINEMRRKQNGKKNGRRAERLQGRVPNKTRNEELKNVQFVKTLLGA